MREKSCCCCDAFLLVDARVDGVIDDGLGARLPSELLDRHERSRSLHESTLGLLTLGLHRERALTRLRLRFGEGVEGLIVAAAKAGVRIPSAIVSAIVGAIECFRRSVGSGVLIVGAVFSPRELGHRCRWRSASERTELSAYVTLEQTLRQVLPERLQRQPRLTRRSIQTRIGCAVTKTARTGADQAEIERARNAGLDVCGGHNTAKQRGLRVDVYTQERVGGVAIPGGLARIKDELASFPHAQIMEQKASRATGVKLGGRAVEERIDSERSLELLQVERREIRLESRGIHRTLPLGLHRRRLPVERLLQQHMPVMYRVMY